MRNHSTLNDWHAISGRALVSTKILQSYFGRRTKSMDRSIQILLDDISRPLLLYCRLHGRQLGPPRCPSSGTCHAPASYFLKLALASAWVARSCSVGTSSGVQTMSHTTQWKPTESICSVAKNKINNYNAIWPYDVCARIRASRGHGLHPSPKAGNQRIR